MTILQANRRHDPYPYTWEPPVAVLVGWLLLAALGVHLARAIANWTSGGGWTWPAGRTLFTSLPAVLTGNPTAGLTTTATAPTASTPALYGWLAAVQLLILAGYTTGLWWAARRRGPGRMKGMASPTEAEQVLGLTRLRRNAPQIRPDLHPTTPKRRRPQ